MFSYIHPKCGEPAFLYDHMPLPEEPRMSNHAFHLDGSPIIPSSRICCDSCGEYLYGAVRISNFREL